jgi:nicotinate-nucleotide adenylyltransferase
VTGARLTGLLGGAFDPPHNAHVALAQTAISQFALERLVVVVTGIPSHKDVDTPAEVRFALAEAAFQGLPGVELSRHEIDLGSPAYTVDTVRWAADRYGEIVFLVGADEFAGFLSWRDPDGVLRAARLGVATRPGYPRQRLDAVLARLAQPARVELFGIPAMPISSTEVRARVSRNEPIDELVPPAVAELIDRLGVYRIDEDAPSVRGP